MIDRPHSASSESAKLKDVDRTELHVGYGEGGRRVQRHGRVGRDIRNVEGTESFPLRQNLDLFETELDACQLVVHWVTSLENPPVDDSS